MALDWPAEMENSLFCLLWRLLEVLRDMLETYSFPAFQTDWGNIQRDMLQIWVKVIFHLPWQLQADYCASFLPPKPGGVLLFSTWGGGESLWNVGRGQNYHVTAFSLTLIFFTHFSAASQGTVCVKTSNPEPPPPHVCPIKHRPSIKHHFWCTHTAHRPDTFSAGRTPH